MTAETRSFMPGYLLGCTVASCAASCVVVHSENPAVIRRGLQLHGWRLGPSGAVQCANHDGGHPIRDVNEPAPLIVRCSAMLRPPRLGGILPAAFCTNTASWPNGVAPDMPDGVTSAGWIRGLLVGELAAQLVRQAVTRGVFAGVPQVCYDGLCPRCGERLLTQLLKDARGDAVASLQRMRDAVRSARTQAAP